VKQRNLVLTVALFAVGFAAGYLVYQTRITKPGLETPRPTDPTPVNLVGDVPEAHYTNTSGDEIIVESPRAAQLITSPYTIRGKARGSWYFEASAPVVLTDWDGKIIAEHYVTAQGDWMTTEFVPFEETLTFTKPASGKNGFLILKNDNPSGLPEHDKSVEIPIRFEN